MKNIIYFFAILLIALIEGFQLISIEILTSRIVSLSFGNTIYVWTLILTFSLIGLSIGYYLGGRLSKYSFNNKILLITNLSIFILLLVVLYNKSSLINLFLKNNLIVGLTLTCIVFIIPFMILFGSISPLLIKLFSEYRSDISEKSVGLIYTISTIGGIIAAIFTGIHLIPNYGIIFSYKILVYLSIFSIFCCFLLLKKHR